MKKLVVRIAAFLIIAGLVALVLIYLSLGRIIKAGIEKGGPMVTQCPVTVGDIAFQPLRGHLRIRDLVLGNPEGFRTDAAFRVAEVRVRMTPGSVFSNRLQVQEVYIDAPEITCEVGLNRTNIGAIQKNVDAFLERMGGGRDEEGPQKTGGDKGPGRKVEIDHVRVENGKVTLSGTILQGGGVPVDLPTLEMRDIGKGRDVSTAEAAAQILRKILFGVVDSVGQSGQVLTDAAKEMGDAAKQVGDDLKKSAGNVVDGVKGLFRKGD
ncbi:MAG: hypothetical protein JXR77_05965 [Lentisphaeria bacterium]|nr:hypothetical protein [Lentisphaeria bacterium]